MARPREFDEDEALERVMEVFWRKGYEGASMSDIEAATGLNKQSLYRLYEDKRGMYLAALKYYDETVIEEGLALLAKPGAAKQKFQRLMTEVLAGAAAGSERRGCLLCDAGGEATLKDAKTKKYVAEALDRLEEAFRAALKASPPYDRDVKRRSAMASKLLAAYFGLRVLVKANMPLETLKNAARQILTEI